MAVQFGILGKFLHVVDLFGLYVETIYPVFAVHQLSHFIVLL